MSKTNKSKSGSRSSRSRSASRSRSRSFSKSRSRSRSVSRSRKRRLSSRSRSRSYSPAHNRERNHPRVYQNRDFRGHNRGYRRPYYFRGRNRGFYPWGQYNRGGYGNYRSNWQNYRQAYSPRRGRSRSRSPKRRSPSPRSRSHSRNSDKSSSDRSRRSSSSRSSSNHSRVESSKRKSAKEKKSSSKDSRPSQAAGDNQGDETKDQTFSGGTSQDTKASESSKPWPDATTYSTGSASRASAVSDLSPRERSPALKSPLQSVVVRRRSPRPSPVPKPSPPLSSTSQMGSSLQSGAGYQSGSHQSQFDHGSGSLSPSKKSPVGKSPPATGSTYGSSQKEESAASGGAAYTKRYLEDQKTENGKDKEQKQTNSDKEKVKEKGSFSDADAKVKSDSFASKTDTEKPFRGSQSPKRYKLRDDFEKKMADFHKEEMDDQDKDKTKGRKESEFDDEPKFMSKVIAGASKNQEEEKSGKWEGLMYAGKEKQRKAEELEEESFTERSKKEERGGAKRSESGHRGFVPEKNFRVTAYKAVQEKSSSPPPRKTSESREKLGAKGDFSSGKSSFSITREAQVNVRMDSFDEDLARPSGLLAQERKLCRDLVHSNKKEQEFRSIFQHIQSAQSQRSPSELFAQHIVTIVHHVKEHHFGSSGMTLHERFTKYLKRGAEQEAAKNKKSPEIHRRIDISPSTFRKHGLAHDEMKSPREPGYKAEGKYKDDPVDLRLDIERRKKHKERDLKRGKSRESVDSRDSSHSRERSTEKTEKTHKGSKKQKKHRRTRDRSRSSSSSSQSSHSYKVEEYPEETEEREESTTGFDKSRLGTKDFVGPSERGGGRARGTFQFRARGRGWGRGNYSGNNNNNSNNDFQKRNREEEWDPEYTPKSKKYYLHDDREGEGSDKWVSRGRGRGAFPRGRGRFMFRKSSTSPKWAHDKFSGEEGEIEDDESGTENREEKDNLQPTTE
ncbi:PREDICTED: thyroid hormone receptor-associated protein 3 [Chinchilla lanigera]|uniref:Thyroid hormone receptor associated protein 3 n=1 Tax=Chinchilla lanigera TaxID=34839 RepID=A0A8C2VQJ9_CHILA|nr:PREDICTED: thyroid hormone receptor-associated protein 3 [Chinchilla lanigera]XP_005395240.1 PREDICTED: thyroid hormone receptor-associated protein 3 [Chinchilla lanigera]XP_005395241.1 PREDICTED: thyroid hormone receptor-associated protein 3 [Chinchilla lanigera]